MFPHFDTKDQAILCGQVNLASQLLSFRGAISMSNYVASKNQYYTPIT